MGAINSVRRLTIQTIGLLEALEPTTAEVALKAEAVDAMQRLVQAKWPHLRLRAFGSSQNGFGGGSSDLDIGLFFDDPAKLAAINWNDRVQILASVAGLLAHPGDLQLEQFIYSARVPLLKFWDTRRKIAIDVTVGNPLALENTRLLRQYGQVDARVRPLVFAVKHWAKQRGINDASNGSLSSYAWIMLVIFYLQTRSTPILPCLPTEASSSLVAACPTPEAMPSRCGHDSVGALLAGFFHFYAWDFDYKSTVVSIRTGAGLPKMGKWGLGLGTWRFSIEDPFDLGHDVGRVIFHPKGQARLNDELRRAATMALVPDGHLDVICAPLEELTCFICNARAHKPRDCPDMWLPPTAATSPVSSSGSASSYGKSTGKPPKVVSIKAATPTAVKNHKFHLESKKRPRRRSKSSPKKKMMLI
ncbi:hypothetical protein SDRG_03934 [Saprolegnia diclina VS20]|uniref:Uncharacterized protein n=1 Tax=Saprolegnia diclina (strain VS20) TaxID=1156394 RepID=T0QWF2_SAPDV|nr:hypothetical protein SDRG_03934 [Saprolegnia diclina VS20]EQC38981.1 hypothetical protein SDRG_03934 [Saprolegnia diclina VS20]|eukprot:XP_008607805.1 hypothetical protein SDRG_03934 [Saprolegnia diclina VS20]